MVKMAKPTFRRNLTKSDFEPIALKKSSFAKTGE